MQISRPVHIRCVCLCDHHLMGCSMKQSTLRFFEMAPSTVFIAVDWKAFQSTLRRSCLITACNLLPYFSIPRVSTFLLFRAAHALLAASLLLQFRKTIRLCMSVLVSNLSFMILAMPDVSKQAGRIASCLRASSMSLLVTSARKPHRATVCVGGTRGGIGPATNAYV